MMETATLISAFVTLLVIIDPAGLTPIFIALTQGMDAKERRKIALRACIIAALLMLMFLFLGEAVLGFIGISMPAFRIAGGILLFLTALEMLFQRRQQRREENAAEEPNDPSVFPLALPLIVGPGTITTLILLAGQADGPADMAAIIGVAFSVLALVFIAFLAAPPIERALGKTGIDIVTRILGMLLAALAIQFVIDGLRQSFGLGG